MMSSGFSAFGQDLKFRLFHSAHPSALRPKCSPLHGPPKTCPAQLELKIASCGLGLGPSLSQGRSSCSLWLGLPFLPRLRNRIQGRRWALATARLPRGLCPSRPPCQGSRRGAEVGRQEAASLGGPSPSQFGGLWSPELCWEGLPWCLQRHDRVSTRGPGCSCSSRRSCCHDKLYKCYPGEKRSSWGWEEGCQCGGHGDPTGIVLWCGSKHGCATSQDEPLIFQGYTSRCFSPFPPSASSREAVQQFSEIWERDGGRALNRHLLAINKHKSNSSYNFIINNLIET